MGHLATPLGPGATDARELRSGAHAGFDHLRSGATDAQGAEAALDSLFTATASALVAVALGSALAYSWARFGTGGKNYPYSVLTIRMLPPIVIAVPFLVYYVSLHLLDTYTGLILVYIATSLPYVIWMMLASSRTSLVNSRAPPA